MAAARKGRTRRPSRRRGAPRAWSWILGLGAVAAIAGIGAVVWSRTDTGQAALLNLGAAGLYDEVQVRLEHVLVPALPAFEPGPATGVDQPDAHDWPLPSVGPTAHVHCRVVPVADDAAWWQVQDRVATAVAAAGGAVLWGERLPRGSGRRHAAPHEERDLLRLDLGVPGRATHTLVLYRAGTARPQVRWGGDPAASAWQTLSRAVSGRPVVALVIDDWGYRRDRTTAGLLALEAPLTMAVLPGLAYSRRYALEGTPLALPPESLTAAAARTDQGAATDATAARLAAGCPVSLGVGPATTELSSRRREILLHLPMEPQGYPEVDPGPDAVLVGMPRQGIAERLADALASLPNVRGVNNHMGSAATSDPATMDALMAELRARDLIFLDSLTSARSVAYDRARAAGVPAARNRIFLDADHQDHAKIRRRLARLVEAARSGGFAVGIGHPHPATLDVLRAELPRLRAEGVHLVTLSELLALQASRAGGGA